MPSPLDRRELGRLIIVHLVAGEVTEKDLSRHKNSGKVETHAQHDLRFGVEITPQQIPGPGRGNAERAGQIGGQQHMRKPHPDQRTEDDREPIGRNELAILEQHSRPALASNCC